MRRGNGSGQNPWVEEKLSDFDPITITQSQIPTELEKNTLRQTEVEHDAASARRPAGSGENRQESGSRGRQRSEKSQDAAAGKRRGARRGGGWPGDRRDALGPLARGAAQGPA